MLQKLPMQIRKTIIFCFPNQNDKVQIDLSSKSRVVADLPFSYSKLRKKVDDYPRVGSQDNSALGKINFTMLFSQV